VKLHLPLVAVVLAFPVTASCAEADAAKQPNYLLFAIKTDLQRELLSSTRADAYMQFDVDECLHDRKFDLKRFDQEAFQKTLAALAHQLGKPEPRLFIGYRYSNEFLNPDQTEAMQQVVKTACRQAGFVNGGTSNLGEGRSWRDKVAEFSDIADDVNATESPVEDDFVRVYPVRTRLSRFLLGDSLHDCFLDLRQPIDGRFKDFSPAARQAIGQCLAKLKLSQKRKLRVHCRATRAGQASVERYFWPSDGKRLLADAFAKELGFRSFTTSMTPMNVSPENLLGKKAPDFTLDALVGGPIHLDELIRGKVALIAFWGVACGACCDEAPHLTALYNQYKDKGLTVVAVNGYDESKQEVERFARAKRLTHPIALKGGNVAEKQYTVASYPVTWLVDHTGAIVDYHLGFDSGDEKVLAKAVARLLAERERANDRK
jgi:peroxiredoxin